MDEGLLDHVKKRVGKQDTPKIVKNLKKKGFEEEHIEKAIAVHHDDGTRISKTGLIVAKEWTERLESGMVSQQYLSIVLNVILGGSFFIVGVVNGIKNILSVILASSMREFNSVRTLEKKTIIWQSIVMGILIMLMGVAVEYSLLWLFVVLMIIITIGIVVLGETYQSIFKRLIKPEERTFFVSKLPQFGLVVVSIGLLVGAWLLQSSFILLLFIVIGGLFIASGICTALLHQPHPNSINTPLRGLAKEVWSTTTTHMRTLFKNSIIRILFIASTISGVVQTLGNSYFGIFIYKSFLGTALGPFMTVAFVFMIAVLTTLVSPTIARLLSKKYGTIPQLVFGTILMALLPLAYWFTPFLLSLSMATMIGTIGAAIVALASGILIRNELGEEEKRMYYMSFPLILVLPSLITIPLGAWLANIIGLKLFFLTLALLMLGAVAPLYFSLLFLVKRRVV